MTAGENGASFAFHQEANRVKRPIEGFVPVLDVSVRSCCVRYAGVDEEVFLASCVS